MVKRGFSELSVVATGVQSLGDRFGKRRRHEYDDLPLILKWRCNLTALSQEHNLYFVAYGQDIYVYVPRYPEQEVTMKPILIVPSQPSGPGLEGYLDPQHPHTINALIVQRLGNDEVVATVRDDGDVDAVLVRHIVQAIQRRAEPDSTFGCVADEVRPVFQDNVGISAWGLAIHSHARVLAVSSNAHEVRIFKFALLDEDREADSGQIPDSTEEDPTHRRFDVTQRVLNGNANIPYIAFCNTSDDPDARWLLATDISGYCRVMDLQTPYGAQSIVQQFRFGRGFQSHAIGFDRLNAGWAIMFLDIRSFQHEQSFHRALGLQEGDVLPGNNNNSQMWDLSDTVESLADNSHAFVYNSPAKKRRRKRQPEPDDSEAASPQHQSNTNTAQPQQCQNVLDDNAESDAESIDGGVTLTEGEDIAFEEDNDERTEDLSENEDNENSDSEILGLPDDDLIEADEDFEDEGTEDSISYNTYYGGKRIFANQPYFFDHSTGLCQDLPCPILHASVKNVYLLQPSNQQYRQGAWLEPLVGLANPLRQAVCNQFGYLNMFDRLNMNAYLPSIGVVVMASQKGRALVLALTKLPPGAVHPARGSPGGPSPLQKTDYAMRVECILPLASQEQQNQRPFAPLHGIAAGPMQGTENASDHHKRWRLLLMYQDHSILSYEIRRPRVGDLGVDVEPVII